jgi:glutathione synthase/RimK-type ligase-like ATP-grasp enzyme
MEKTYLSDLQVKGVPVLESVWVSAADSASLKNLMQQNSWPKAVVKPMISAAAYNTEVVSLDAAEQHQEKFDHLRGNGGVIVQQFADEIITGGEWSLMFFNKEYSHAVIKRPQNGDFRVQRDFGGTVHTAEAPAHLIDQARAVLDLVESDLLYARVDGIERGQQLFLMELELIEPHLFFEQSQQSAHLFASVLIELSKSGVE